MRDRLRRCIFQLLPVGRLAQPFLSSLTFCGCPTLACSWQGWGIQYAVAATFDQDTGTPIHLNGTRSCSLANAGPSSSLGRGRLGNGTEHLGQTDCEERAGSGQVCTRTRGGCSILEGESGRRLPAGYGSADLCFRPPDWAGHLHTRHHAFVSRCRTHGRATAAVR